MKYLVVIQARIGSTRLPNKVMQLVGGVPMVKRVWNAAKEVEKMYGTAFIKTVMAWPERYPDLNENDVLGRFQRLVKEFGPDNVIRLTADCPLLRPSDIRGSIERFEYGLKRGFEYFNNYKDGRDVQIFTYRYLFDPKVTHREHVIKDTYATGGTSVNTLADLEKVRNLCKEK